MPSKARKADPRQHGKIGEGRRPPQDVRTKSLNTGEKRLHHGERKEDLPGRGRQFGCVSARQDKVFAGDPAQGPQDVQQNWRRVGGEDIRRRQSLRDQQT